MRERGFPRVSDKIREALRNRFQAIGTTLKKAVPGSLRGEYVVWGLSVGLSLCFVWSALSGPQGVIEFLKLRGALHRLEEENRDLLVQNQSLEKEVYLLRNSPNYLEKVAREEYGYTYPGETVFTFSAPLEPRAWKTLEEETGDKSPSPP
jgi:cell division protein FtsB